VLLPPGGVLLQQVVSFAPFALFSILCLSGIVYGLADLRPGFAHAAVYGLMMLLGYLVSCQVTRAGNSRQSMRDATAGGPAC
jgi:hypothetical protein